MSGSSLLLLAALSRVAAPSEPASDPSAEPLPLRVDWTAEPSCPDAEALRVELVRLLHRELRFDPDAEARVAGIIRGHPGAFVLELSISAGDLHEQRTLEAERCEEFRTAAALVVALALEPWAAGVGVREVPEPEPTEAEARDEPGPELDDIETIEAGTDRAGEPATAIGLDLPGPPPGPPSGPPPGLPRVGLLVQGGLGIAQHATVAGGLGGAIAYLGRGWRVDLTGLHWWPERIAAGNGVTVRVRLTVGGVRGCWVPSRGRWELPLCGGVEAGAMNARATGPSVAPIASTGLWLGLLAEAGVAWRATSWLAVRATSDLTVAVWRPTFHLAQGSNIVPVFTAPPVGARILAGLELRLAPRDE